MLHEELEAEGRDGKPEQRPTAGEHETLREELRDDAPTGCA